MIGAAAILLWATLALFTTLTARVPPVQLVAMAFFVAFLVGSAAALVRGRHPFGVFRQPAGAWLLSVGGLFGYHACYFLAFRLAEPIEVNLINYFWPLLIVLFSALLPGERLRRHHVAGAGLGLLGVFLLVTQGAGLTVRMEALPGYGTALAAAVIWAGYSVLNRRYHRVPTEAVTGFCLATASLAAVLHLALEDTVLPRGTEWAAVLALGLGPVGAAFFVWDHGTKHGHLPTLGALAYTTPLLSTLLLILSGRGDGHWTVWAACLLVIGGAVLASRDLFRRPAAVP